MYTNKQTKSLDQFYITKLILYTIDSITLKDAFNLYIHFSVIYLHSSVCELLYHTLYIICLQIQTQTSNILDI